jgi:hypothetical protein
MKFTNQKLINDIGVLRNIAQKQLPVKISYAIAKNISKVDSELKIYNKERQKLVDKYAEKDKNGQPKINKNNQYNIKKECMEDWNRDVQELLSISVELDVFTFSVDLLDGFNISPAEMGVLARMVDDGE